MELCSRNRLGPVPGDRLHFRCETYTIYAPRSESLPSKDSCAPCHSLHQARRGLGSALVQRNFPLRVEMVFYGSLSRVHRSSLQIPVWQGRPVLPGRPVWSTVVAPFLSSYSCGARCMDRLSWVSMNVLCGSNTLCLRCFTVVATSAALTPKIQRCICP